MRAKRKDKRAITARPKTPTLAEYYTEAELAEELGVHPRTIWLWRRDGKGPPVTMLGRVPLFRIKAFKQWLTARERQMPRERTGQITKPQHDTAAA